MPVAILMVAGMTTSWQRRRNDRRRFWFQYLVYRARRLEQYGQGHALGDMLIDRCGEKGLRALYRADKRYAKAVILAMRREGLGRQ